MFYCGKTNLQTASWASLFFLASIVCSMIFTFKLLERTEIFAVNEQQDNSEYSDGLPGIGLTEFLCEECAHTMGLWRGIA